MPVYEYVVLDQKGKPRRGILDAEGPAAAKRRLRSKGLYPVEIRETKRQAREKVKRGGLFDKFFWGISGAELNSVTRLLSTLLGAGLPLDTALATIIGQVKTPSFKRILAQIKDSVTEGNSLAFALGQHPKVFSSLYVNMVRSGEVSGTLDLVLARLAEFGEHQQALKNKIRAALAYPIFMTVVGVFVLIFLMSFVVPNITKIFHQIHKALPLPTVILIGVSNLMGNYWWVLGFTLVGLVVAFIFIKERPKAKEYIDLYKLKMPVLGTVYTKLMLSRFARTLGNLLMAGIPIITGLQIASNVVQNIHIRRALDETANGVEGGKSLADGLSKSELFPGILVQMVGVGEQSGQLEEMLLKAAETYEKEIDAKISGLTSVLEPTLILIMGAIVGFIVVSILLPIFEMNQLVR